MIYKSPTLPANIRCKYFTKTVDNYASIDGLASSRPAERGYSETNPGPIVPARGTRAGERSAAARLRPLARAASEKKSKPRRRRNEIDFRPGAAGETAPEEKEKSLLLAEKETRSLSRRRGAARRRHPGPDASDGEIEASDAPAAALLVYVGRPLERQ